MAGKVEEMGQKNRQAECQFGRGIDGGGEKRGIFGTFG